MAERNNTSTYAKQVVELLQETKKALEKCARVYFDYQELTIPQMSILLLLHREGALNVSDISSKMGLSKSTISGIIDRLEQQGLVIRERTDADRRVITVSLTEKHAAVISELELKFEQFLADIFQGVSASDLQEIITGLTRFKQILGKKAEDLF